MTPMQRLSAHAVQVTLPEMDQVIRRAFRATNPQMEKTSWGEIVYILTPDDEDPTNVIRVQTSIFEGQTARGQGEDSMRVVLMNTKTKRPIAGKEQRIHRVEGWKDNLRKRISDAIEKFEDLKEEREKAKQQGAVREEQERFRQERPQEAQAERQRQIAMLEALSLANLSSSDAFANMLRYMRRPGQLLTDKQRAWAEREFARLRR